MSTIDSKGNRILEDADQTGFEDVSLTIEYEQMMNVENFFFNNQTFCSSYDSSVDVGNHYWTDLMPNGDLDCDHTYV